MQLQTTHAFDASSLSLYLHLSSHMFVLAHAVSNQIQQGMAAMDYDHQATCTIVGNTGIYPTTGQEYHRPDLGKYLCIEINVNFETADGDKIKNQRIHAHSRR